MCVIDVGGEYGSSPRMRGARNEKRQGQFPAGIIPAYAGSTLVAGRSCVAPEDHPRVCGEHPRSMLFTISATGSSPRMRGAHGRQILLLAGLGIIPAYAGSTARTGVFLLPPGDHPRVCGEHRLFTLRFTTTAGSSPRMRGAHILV